MIVNHQNEVRLNIRATRKFAEKLRRRLRLGRRDFNVCFVEDRAITALNAAYRGKAKSTDVLSFPWAVGDGEKRRRIRRVLVPTKARRKAAPGRTGRLSRDVEGREFANFLGDIVISVEAARQNARMEGHSVAREIRWLILHGALHLMGFDHESDAGEMAKLEHKLRAQMNI